MEEETTGAAGDEVVVDSEEAEEVEDLSDIRDVVAVAEVETVTGVAAVALTVEDALRRAPGAEVQENTADPRCPQGPQDDQTVKIAPIPGARIEADRHSNDHKQRQIQLRKCIFICLSLFEEFLLLIFWPYEAFCILM